MSEMVERAVKAVLDDIYEHGDAYTKPDYEDGDISVDGTVDCRRLVRIVTEAIRTELVERMEKSGYLSIEDLDAVLKLEKSSDFEAQKDPKAT